MSQQVQAMEKNITYVAPSERRSPFGLTFSFRPSALPPKSGGDLGKDRITVMARSLRILITHPWLDGSICEWLHADVLSAVGHASSPRNYAHDSHDGKKYLRKWITGFLARFLLSFQEYLDGQNDSGAFPIMLLKSTELIYLQISSTHSLNELQGLRDARKQSDNEPATYIYFYIYRPRSVANI